jgi:FkbM family methyltransferase
MKETNMDTATGSLRREWGMFKSRLMYDFKPFNRKKMVRFYSAFIQAGDLCFDVGAHTGNRTGAWLSMGARVVAVEPQPACILLLEKKYSDNARFYLEKKALGPAHERASMYISSLNPAISTLSDQWKDIMNDFDYSVDWDDRVEVEVTTLDEMMKIYGLPVFCKIDVEGYEAEVLAGLSVPLPALSFEFFPTTPHRTVECITLLEKLGSYRYNWSLTESFRMNSTGWLTSGEMITTLAAYRGRKSGDIYGKLAEKEIY